MQLKFNNPNETLPKQEMDLNSKTFTSDYVLIAIKANIYHSKDEVSYGLACYMRDLDEVDSYWYSNENWLDELIGEDRGDEYKFAWAYIPEQNIDWSKIKKYKI